MTEFLIIIGISFIALCVILTPIVAFSFRKELMAAYREYKDEQKRIPER